MGDCGERGESTGDGSSSRIETRDGEDGEFDSAMMKLGQGGQATRSL